MYSQLFSDHAYPRVRLELHAATFHPSRSSLAPDGAKRPRLGPRREKFELQTGADVTQHRNCSKIAASGLQWSLPDDKTADDGLGPIFRLPTSATSGSGTPRTSTGTTLKQNMDREDARNSTRIRKETSAARSSPHCGVVPRHSMHKVRI